MNKDLNNAKLGDDELNNVAGGAEYLVFDATNIIGSDPVLHYELLDGKGDVVSRSDNPGALMDYARHIGKTVDFTDNWGYVLDRRNQKH